ncbi:MAG: NAD(P)/FAD-dependent oxidoreductase [Chitinophagaceae bacterium]|nr:NAD(P)/FAD-dependent oxidoreductase [Chitinophagaceae bacterium]
MPQKVIIIGGGFAGLQLVEKLDPSLFDILLIDRINHHQFQPLFYQVAACQLEPASISFPLRHIFKRKKNVQIRLTEVKEIIPQEKLIKTDIGEFEYDILVIATGCQSNFFGNKEIQQHALTLKTTYDAIQIRNHVLLNFERLISAEEYEKESLLNMAIVGAGPTGVELAGAFAEIKKHILPGDYPGIDLSRFTIYLIEGSNDTLNSMSEKAKKTSRKYLEDMGVTVITGVFVSSYDGHLLTLNNGVTIKTQTVIWAAGVIGNLISGLPKECIATGNRLWVNRQNQLLHHEDIYVMGDMAMMQTPLYPKGHPQVANVAIHQAKLLARNLKAKMQGKSLKEYEYKNLGAMATIGKNKAVVDLPFIQFTGYFAWLTWMFVHLMLILSVRNKLIIFINWAWTYITKDTSLRLILKDKKEG